MSRTEMKRFMLFLATIVFSFFLASFANIVCEAPLTTCLIVMAGISTLVGVVGVPFLLEYPTGSSVAVFGIPAMGLALVFGFIFIGWIGGGLFAGFALVVYLLSAFIAT